MTWPIPNREKQTERTKPKHCRYCALSENRYDCLRYMQALADLKVTGDKETDNADAQKVGEMAKYCGNFRMRNA